MNQRTWTRILIVFAMLFPGLGALGYFVLAQDQWLRIIYAASKAIQFSLPAVFVFVVLKEKFTPTRLTSLSLFAGLRTGTGFLVLTLVSYYLIFKPIGLLADSSELIAQKISEFGVASPLSFLMMAIYISALHSFLEEYYWRWFVFRKLREFMSLKGSILLSSAAFTLHHIVVINHYSPPTYKLALTIVASFAVFIAGAVWAYQYERHRNLWVVWISHLLVDSALMYVGYDLVFSR
jgi:uncharacterized protein